ncbi:MAG: hypothetical protein HOP13_06605 [Alphaproteobacteria bacterium]|nr:hypothetical protein [Alphaproteobacteria bacterium]
MLNRIINGLVVALMGAVLVLFELGRVQPGDALFIAAAIVAVFTGQQLIQREQMGFVHAATTMFTEPKSWGSRSSFAAYFACLALGALVSVQAVLFA